jgi:DNA-binding response OmpR family regulator
MREQDEPCPEAEPSVEIVRQPSSEADAPLHTIHLLDHDSEILLSLFDFLSNAGFTVSATSNAGDALQYVTREHPDVLIASMEMSELPGLEVLQRVRELSPSTRVILTSVRADWYGYEDVLRHGGADLVAKPFKGMILLRAVERVLGS